MQPAAPTTTLHDATCRSVTDVSRCNLCRGNAGATPRGPPILIVEGTMITIAVLNMKGGSGKSSTCYHLGGMFARRGRRVLLVDNDPQSSLTQGLWGPSVLRELDPSRTIDAVYRGDPLPEDVVHPTGLDGLRIL